MLPNIPSSSQPLPTRASGTAVTIYSELKRLRILVINDEQNVNQFLRLILESDGHVVLTTDSGAQGIERAALRPELIICDMKMPGIDGFGVLRALRENPSTRHIPFILLTGSIDPDDMQRGVAQGADDCVPMPFEKKDLTAAIAASCHKRDLLARRLGTHHAVARAPHHPQRVAQARKHDGKQPTTS